VKIVLVAESGFTRTAAHVNLQAAGHQVTPAEPACLLDVLVIMRDVLPNLIILDQDLPRCDCETTVRIIREDPVLAGTPILVLKDRADSEAVVRMGRWRQVNFLDKPLRVEALLQVVPAQLHVI